MMQLIDLFILKSLFSSFFNEVRDRREKKNICTHFAILNHSPNNFIFIFLNTDLNYLDYLKPLLTAYKPHGNKQIY